MTLKQQLIKRIRATGSITVAEYMEPCVAHYYAARDPFGVSGDFTTAPEISQIFGELIGAWMADAWQRSGAKHAILCEPGPGRGTLMQDLLRVTETVPGFHSAIDIHLVETSPILRAAQKEALAPMHPRIHWHDSIDSLPEAPLFLVANEFFDALPIHQYIRIKGEWQERKIACRENALTWLTDDRVISEASPVATNIMARIATHIRAHGGAALIIDYGYSEGAQGSNTLQALKHHKHVDPLSEPGEVDITAHVDFGALLHTAKGRGAHGFGALAQGTFLKRLGAELRATALCKKASPEQQKTILSGLERLTAPHAMGELFKVIAITSSLDKPAGF